MLIHVIYGVIITLLSLGAIPFIAGSIYTLFFLRKYSFRFVLLSLIGLMVVFLFLLSIFSLMRDGVVISLNLGGEWSSLFLVNLVFAIAGAFFIKRFFNTEKQKGYKGFVRSNKVFLVVSTTLLLYLVYYFFHSPLYFKIQSAIAEHTFASVSSSELNKQYTSKSGLFSFSYPQIFTLRIDNSFASDMEEINLMYPPKNYTICSIRAQRKNSTHPFALSVWGGMTIVNLGESTWEKYTDKRTFGETSWSLVSDTLYFVLSAPNVQKGASLCEKIVGTVKVGI